jgi:hypothetical protein
LEIKEKRKTLSRTQVEDQDATYAYTREAANTKMSRRHLLHKRSDIFSKCVHQKQFLPEMWSARGKATPTIFARAYVHAIKQGKTKVFEKNVGKEKMFSNEIIEIIDIECVLLSFLSKKIVSTKWRIYNGILVGPMQTPEARYFARLQGVRIVFQLQSLQKIFYRDLKQ